MMLLAQIKDATEQFYKAADTWGLATTVLLAMLIVVVFIGLIVVWKLAQWFKPKIDSGFTIHFGLVQALTEAVPGLKMSMSGLLDEMKTQTQGIKVQTDNIKTQTTVLNHVAAKLDEWPSDTERICKAEQALRATGLFKETDIEKVLKRRKAKVTDHEMDEYKPEEEHP